MASNRYIELLADAATRAEYATAPDTHGQWHAFDSAWENLTQHPQPHALTYFAITSFALLRRLTGTPIPALAAQATELHVAKNAGYAGDAPDPWANFRLSHHFGVSPFHGILVRLSDKYIRTQNLRRNPANDQVGEAITDTIADGLAYALIARCIAEETAS